MQPVCTDNVFGSKSFGYCRRSYEDSESVSRVTAKRLCYVTTKGLPINGRPLYHVL